VRTVDVGLVDEARAVRAATTDRRITSADSPLPCSMRQFMRRSCICDASSALGSRRRLRISQARSMDATPIESVAATRLSLGDFTQGVVRSISQVFLKGSAVAALLLLAGLAVNSIAAAVAALGGAVLAVLVAHALGAESELVTAGLLGFSPVLTAIALATVFHAPGARVVMYAALGTTFTVIAQLACNVALAPLGIPALTAPFILVSWLFLLPQASAKD
jgi:urea transporter